MSKVSVPSRFEKGFTTDLVKSDVYKAVEKGAAEKFGVDSRAYKTITNRMVAENGTGSQFFFNTETGLYLPEGVRVSGVDDLARINSNAPEFFDGTFYTDTPELVLRTAKASYEQNTQILEGLVSQVRQTGHEFSPERPLLISGLELVGDDNSQNPYGLQLKLTDKTTIQTDERFAHGKNSIPFGNGSKTLWTKKDGLSGVYLSRNGRVDSNDGGLAGSSGDGRVVSFDERSESHAEGVEFENLEREYLSKLENLRDRINTRLAQ